MKLLFAFLTFVVVVKCAPQKYTTKYDNVDLNEVLKSDRLLRNYLNCLLDKGKCGSDGAELKGHIEDALITNCEKCSKKQKDGSQTVIRFLLKNKRAWFNELEAKYDPKKTYIARYGDELRSEGIDV